MRFRIEGAKSDPSMYMGLYNSPTGTSQVLVKRTIYWVLPTLSNSGIITIIWLYLALKRTPKIDCY